MRKSFCRVDKSNSLGSRRLCQERIRPFWTSSLFILRMKYAAISLNNTLVYTSFILGAFLSLPSPPLFLRPSFLLLPFILHPVPFVFFTPVIIFRRQLSVTWLPSVYTFSLYSLPRKIYCNYPHILTFYPLHLNNSC